jgi:hypothetical protein
MTDPLAHAAQLALLSHQLIGEGKPWSGSTFGDDGMKTLAMAATGALSMATFLEGIQQAGDPQKMLHEILAMTWAAGFKTGSMHAEAVDR